MEILKGYAEEVMKFMTGLGSTVNVVSIAIVVASCFLFAKVIFKKKKNLPPTIPGGKPFLGNVLQLRNVRPHYLFSQWAEKYGPIYHFRAGMKDLIVCTSPELFKEVTITKFVSISKRELTTAFKLLSDNKGMVVMADYGPEYRSHKKHYVTHLLGPVPQRENRWIREEEATKMLQRMFKDVPSEGKVVNLRLVLREALFDFSMRQGFGFKVESTYVPGVGSVNKRELHDYLVYDPIAAGAIMDWRNFWPIFSWVPNSLDKKLHGVVSRKKLVLEELLNQYKKNASLNGPTGCYCDALYADSTFSTEEELLTGAWEPIIESSDTTSVTSEWILFELAEHPHIQERLYNEINTVAGDRSMNEDDIPKLPLMDAVIKETLRKHSPLPVMPPRLVEEDITLGGYDIPKGWEIILNIWGMAMDKNVWSDPDVWNPDRCLKDPSIDMGFKNFTLTPFGGGKRMCAGMAQTMSIVPLLIGSLVQHFEFTLPPSELESAKENEGMVTVTTYKATPLQAFAKPRVNKVLPNT